MFVLIRLIVIVVRAYAGNAFAGWQFSESTYPTLIYQIPLAQNFGATSAIEWGAKMKVTQLYIARHLLAVICGLIGMVLLAIGAHAALDLHASDAAKAVSTEESASAIQLALIIGNGHYPDAAEPLNQPINDASGLADAMRRHGFDVDVVEDATKADMARAVERLKSRIKPGSIVMLFFGGYGVQSGHESYMIPTDATIWKESDVRHEGMSVETVLDVMKERGARAKLVVLDASRRNPYERRFRSYSHGLALINAPNNALIISSNTPGKVADDMKGEHSVLVTELLNELNAQVSAEGVFNKTRVAVSRALQWRADAVCIVLAFGGRALWLQREFGFIGAPRATVDQHREWSARSAEVVQGLTKHEAYLTGELPGRFEATPPGRARSEGEKMISWRLIVPAVLVAAAVAGCFTYFVSAPAPVEAVQRLSPTAPDIKGPDTRTRTFIDQRSKAEEEAKAVFERAAAAILRQAPELQASAGVNEPSTAEHIPLPKRRPLPRP